MSRRYRLWIQYKLDFYAYHNKGMLGVKHTHKIVAGAFSTSQIS
jgi:hypothetical protein